MSKQINNPKKQETDYGTYTTMFFDGNFRYDNYEPSNKYLTESTEAIMCLSNTDLSEVKQSNPTVKEREKCHACFAGYPHTVALCSNNQIKP